MKYIITLCLFIVTIFNVAAQKLTAVAKADLVLYRSLKDTVHANTPFRVLNGEKVEVLAYVDKWAYVNYRGTTWYIEISGLAIYRKPE